LSVTGGLVRSVLVGGAVLVSVLSFAGRARAAANAELALELRNCQDVEETALRSLLAIELSTLKVAPRGFTLTVTCDGTNARLNVDPGTGAAAQELEVQLGAVAPGARTRLVALTASELIAKFQPTPEPVAAKPEPVAPRPLPAKVNDEPKPAPVAESAGAARAELSLQFVLRRGGTPATSLFGGALGAEYWLMPALSLALELRAERGRARLPLADVDYTPLTAAVAPLFGGSVGAWHLRAGPGVRAGVLLLAAHASAPNAGRNLDAAWVAGLLRAQLSLDVTRHLAISAGFEANYIAWPVHGQVQGGAELVDANGAWFGGGLGVALVL